MMEYTQEEFEECYNKIYDSLTKDGIAQQQNCVIFLGGQPGAGKSHFIGQDEFINYIKINGDDYRKYHPRFKDIVLYDVNDMVERTQEFVNACIERLIKNLSDEGYNLVIEGTLRSSQVTINTCQILKDKGYQTDLYIVAIDAVTSWNYTINRAELLKEMGDTPRLVPIDKYNYIVNNLVNSVDQIDSAGCFDAIHIVDRNSKIIYPDNTGRKAASIMEEKLNVGKWNEMYDDIANKFFDLQIDMLQTRKKHKGR